MNTEALAPEHELVRRPPPSAASMRERILALMVRRAETGDPWVSAEDPDTGCARYRLVTDGGDSTPPFDEIVAEPVDDTREQLALELPAAEPTSAYDPGSEWA